MGGFYGSTSDDQQKTSNKKQMEELPLSDSGKLYSSVSHGNRVLTPSLKKQLLVLLMGVAIGVAFCKILYPVKSTTVSPILLQEASSSPNSFSSNIPLPSKYGLPYVTPLKTQDHRGTCWDFATVGVLEHSYRVQGINNGWLEPQEYLALSEQAYGAEVLKLCSGPFDSQQQINCRVPGNSIWENSTEGGEASELYYLVNGLKNSVFPHSVCPYDPSEEDGNDSTCSGIKAYNTGGSTTNPLSFDIKGMKTYYDDLTVKRALYNNQESSNIAMTFTTSMPYVSHYLPCIGDTKRQNGERCDPESQQCVICPPALRGITTCCIPMLFGDNYNMNGEFITRDYGMTLEGGHVMLLVGYNDAYRSKDGLTGGYILKNSWFDGTNPPLGPTKGRGSHSMRYWLQEISDWEERTMCPNSESPYSWYQCGNSESVTSGSASGGDTISKNKVDPCLTLETQLYAKTNIQPLDLKCADAEFCTVDDDITYFMRNMTESGDIGLTRACFFEHNTKVESDSRDICLPPMLIQKLAYVLKPVVVKQNDPDRCGFYFFPYEAVRQYVALFEGFYVNSFEINWHKQSYVKNAKEFPNLDYTDVKTSMKNQKEYNFVGPFPFANVIQGRENANDEL